jgi:hypothetical protein
VIKNLLTTLFATTLLLAPFASAAKPIQHDAEYSILAAQNGEAWAADDKAIGDKLAEIRKKNDGKPPNINYMLLDDVGFGEVGMDEISVIRGYKTPNISSFTFRGQGAAAWIASWCAERSKRARSSAGSFSMRENMVGTHWL